MKHGAKVSEKRLLVRNDIHETFIRIYRMKI